MSFFSPWSESNLPNGFSSLESLANSVLSSARELQPDPRTASKLMMSTMSYPIGIAFTYIVVNLIVGHNIVKGKIDLKLRQNLTPFLHAFNIVFVCMSGVLGLLLCYRAYYNLNYSLLCQPLDPSKMSREAQYHSDRVAHLIWCFYVFKLIEICDIFFLFGLNKTLTGFQLYHHTSAVMLAWLGATYACSGNTVFPVVINCFTAVLVYGFHQLHKVYKAKGLRFSQFSLGFQLLQFGIILGHSSVNLWMGCGYPRFASGLLIAYMLSFFGAVVLQGVLRQRYKVSKKFN